VSGDPRYPIGGEMSDVLRGLLRRLRLPALTERYSTRAVLGLFAFINGLLSIAIMSAAAVLTGQPLIFPSLGPTAFLLFYTPRAPTASPRNTIIGHFIGVVAGYVSLLVFGLTERGPAFAEGVTWGRVGAAALSLALTSGFMAWLLAPHPPAGATTLIVSLGIMPRPSQLAFLMLAVILLVAQGLVINRSAGIDYPLWKAPT
jgi:CBS domain-containing membrane protein